MLVLGKENSIFLGSSKSLVNAISTAYLYTGGGGGNEIFKTWAFENVV